MESAVEPVKRHDRPVAADPVGRAFFWLAMTFAAAAAVLAGLLIGVKPDGRLIIALSITLGFAGALGVAAGALLGARAGWRADRGVSADLGRRDAGTEAAARMHGLLGIAADWYWEQDAGLRFTQVVGTLEETTGIAVTDVLGRRRWELDAFEVAPEVWNAHRADLQARRPFRNLVLKWRRPDGGSRYVSISGASKFGPEREFLGYWGIARDVTEQAAAQRVLAASERRYRALFDRSPLPKIIHRGGIALMVNDAAVRLFGFASPSELTGINLLDLYPADERERVATRIAQLESMPEGEELPAAELRVRSADGSIHIVQGTGVRVMLNSGLATLSIYFDITARKSAEQQLRRSEAMLSHLFEASPDAIVVSELQTSRLAMVNERFVSMFGYSRDELIGRTSLELGIWVDPAQRVRVVEGVERDGIVHAVPVTRRTKDGRVLSMRYSAARMQLDGEQYMIAALRDVTEQEREHLQCQAILDNASVGIAFSRDRVIQLANPRFEEMFGWAPGTLAGQLGAVVWPLPEAYAEVGRRLGPRLARGELVVEEVRMQRRNGGAFWCRLLARAIDPGNPVSGGTIWIAEDVTSEHNAAAELAAAKEAAEAANRTKTAFLANTSHELRTPLNGLLGLTRLALRPNLDCNTQRRYLEQICDSGETLHAIISDILDLSKIEAGKLSLENVPFDLHALLASVAASYRELAQQKGLAFGSRIEHDVPVHVIGDPTRLRQLLSNFLSNALKFTTHGEVALRCACANGHVRLSVSDTGIGIDAATRARLFNPFTQGDVSTTRRFGGTGLGLSICRHLAELMGGAVGVDSEPGVGSSFWVELPLPAAAVSRLPAEVPDVSAAGALRGVRVLLAEDNDVNRLIAETLLTEWGASVVVAVDGRAAVAAVQDAGADFDVVLMDLHMPVMSGLEATEQLRLRYAPRVLPILALTAAALGPEREQCLAAGMNDFIAKPFEERQLLETLRRWTARRGAADGPSGG